jgi:putative membrane-bound dehydrogenase-like protein
MKLLVTDGSSFSQLFFIVSLVLFCLNSPWLATAEAEHEPKEPVVDAPLPPNEAARTMTVPDGFQVTLFAGEPDVQQPIGFCIDDRGRLWVAEAYNYPHHGTTPGDRILIFEDSDGDGRFDKRTVFYDQLNYVTGIEVGFGGAWVVSPPYFYFIPDQNGDDKPDGAPQVLLDGFGNHANSHNLANGLAWGPDGWLYGTHGRTNWSMLGKPGTTDDERIRFDGGVYRYHPVRHVWESFADGTTNPWGIDWNDFGEAFVCNCVTPHLYHVIQGAHYEPWRNRQSGEFTYQRIPTIADHLHFVGTTNVRAALGSAAEDAAGGGHAHCGTMVYLGDNWPDAYRNTLFTNNIHGKRINNDILQRSGSGYTASHGRDIMRAQDPWYMGVTLRYGPDGAVYASDWSDTGECHSVVNTQRETGRIFKIAYGKPVRRNVEIATLSNLELAQLQLDRNDWYVQHARRLLQEHAARGDDLQDVTSLLQSMFVSQPETPKKLRALWALHAIEKLPPEFLLEQLGHADEYIRGWAVRLLCEPQHPSATALARFHQMATSDTSAYVRLQLASALQRLSAEDRWELAVALSEHAEDSTDDNLPLMIWYGIEPLIHVDATRFARLAAQAKIPLLAQHIGRRVASAAKSKTGLDQIVQVMVQPSTLYRAELLTGVIQGLAGRRSVPMPAGWPECYGELMACQNATVREKATELALIFDDPKALQTLRAVATDPSQKATVRNRALQALVHKRVDNLTPLLLQLVDDLELQQSAIRGLAEYKDEAIPQRLLAKFSQLDVAIRQDVLQTLASRPGWAMQLLDAVAAEQISRSEITAFTARQIQAHQVPELTASLAKVWGELRSSSADKAKLIASYKKQLTSETIKTADRSAGREIFQKSCAACHRLFDAGGDIGPNITGSQRTNIDYLLQTIIDPSAAVSRDYQVEVIETVEGRIITGVIIEETQAAITVRTPHESIVVPTGEIEERVTSPASLMPEGLLLTLTDEQVQQLIAYLMSPEQVPLLDVESTVSPLQKN